VTCDDITRMAREVWSAGEMYIGPNAQSLERFADLVAAAEREACAAVCEGSLIIEINPDRSAVLEQYLLTEGAKAGTKAAAKAIRARGKK
jgi:hypothetical protein